MRTVLASSYFYVFRRRRRRLWIQLVILIPFPFIETRSTILQYYIHKYILYLPRCSIGRPGVVTNELALDTLFRLTT